jgi:CBS-domain-containing membrane protein
MNASDVMITGVTTVKPSTKMQEVAEILLTKRISGMPVVDDSGKVVGTISEGDLLRRFPEGHGRRCGDRPSGWVRLLIDGGDVDTEYVRIAGSGNHDLHVISAKPKAAASQR